MLRRGQAGEFKNGGQRLPSPFSVSLSRTASVDGLERAFGMVFGGGSPLARPDDALVRRNRCLTFRRFAAYGAYRRACGSPAPNQSRRGLTRRSSWFPRRAAFLGEGVDLAVEARESGVDVVDVVAAARRLWRRRLPSAISWPRVDRVERACNHGRLLRAGFPGATGSPPPRFSPPPTHAAAKTAGCLSRDADRPAAAGFLTVPARRPTLFG